MKLLSIAVAVLFIVTVNSYSQSIKMKTKNEQTMEAEQIAKPILKSLEEGWNKASGTDFVTHFADTSEFVTIRGELHRKSTKLYLANAHQGLFMSIYKDSKVVYQLLQATFINEQTMLVHVQTELDAPVGPLAGKNFSTVSLVLVQVGKEWKIRAFHNTLVKK